MSILRANVIHSSVSDRKVRFLLEEAMLQNPWYPCLAGWSFTLWGRDGMGWENQLMRMMIDWTELHFSYREAMLTRVKCSIGLLGKWSLQEEHKDICGKPL